MFVGVEVPKEIVQKQTNKQIKEKVLVKQSAPTR